MRRASSTHRSIGHCLRGETDVGPSTHEPAVAWSAASGPNPFGASTRLSFSLARREAVTLTVHDVAGRELARLVDGEHRKAGVHELGLDGSNLASGVYLCRLQAGDTVLSRKLVHFR